MRIDWNIEKYRCDYRYRQGACACKSTSISCLRESGGYTFFFYSRGKTRAPGRLRARESLKKEEGGVRHPSGETCVDPDSFDVGEEWKEKWEGCWLALEHRLINKKRGSDIGYGVDKD